MTVIGLIMAVGLFSLGAAGPEVDRCEKIGLLGEFESPTGRLSQPFGRQILYGSKSAQRLLLLRKPESCFEFKLLDIKNSAANIPDVIEKAVEVEEIFFFIGLGISNQALVAREALRETKSVLLSPTASSDELNRSGERVVTMFPSNTEIARSISYKAKALGVDRAAVVYNSNDAYSQNLARAFSREFRKMGGQAAPQISFRSGLLSSDSIREFEELRSADHVFLPVFELDVALVVQALQERGIEPHYLGSDSWGTYSNIVRNLAGEFSFKATAPLVYDPDLKTAGNKIFLKYYNKLSQEPPTDLAAFSFEALILIDRLLSTCSKDKLKVELEECVRQAVPFDGTTGRIENVNRLNILREVRFRELVFSRGLTQ